MHIRALRARKWRKLALLALPIALVVGTVPASALTGTAGDPPAVQPIPDRQSEGLPNGVALTRVVVPTQADIDLLINLGFDVAEYSKPVNGGFEIQMGLTEADAAQVTALGYDVRGSIYEEDELTTILDGRARALRAEALMAAADTDKLTPLRVEWFNSSSTTDGSTQRYLAIEVKSNDTASNTNITATWAGRTGSPLTLSRFTDAGVYMYHRITTPVVITGLATPPTEVTLTSSKGASITVPVTQWLGAPRPAPSAQYVSDFITQAQYPMTPTAGLQPI